MMRRGTWRANAVLAAALLLCAFSSTTLAQFEPAGDSPPDENARRAEKAAAEAKAAYQANLARYKGSADMLVLPGLLADRKQKSVRIWARATSVAYADPIEFWAIPQDSGKDYEALSVAFAKCSDVHKALEFIGLKAGRPVDFTADRFWPKGERVIMTFEWDQPPAPDAANKHPVSRRVRAEDLILNVNTRKPLSAEGLVFCGAAWITPEGGKPMYAGDVHDSKAIASDYNNRASVLDVPRQAMQGAVYGSLKLNPAYRFTPAQSLQILLEPEHKDGRTRVMDLLLRVSMPAGNGTPQAARYVLTDASGKQLNNSEDLIHLLAAFGQLTEAGKDPFVTIRVDDAMPLRSVKQVYGMLMQMDSEKGIRIDAPPEGHLYYRAFFPDEQWRDRSKRLGRPWELHLLEKDKKVAGMLILPADEIDDNNGQGDLRFPVGSPDETARILAEKSGKFSQVVYIYAPPSMSYGALMAFIRPALKTHPAMHVFLPPGAQ